MLFTRSMHFCCSGEPLPCLKEEFRLMKVDSYLKNEVLNEDVHEPLNISIRRCYILF